MPLLEIITGKDTPILRTKTKKVDSINKKTLRLISDMKETMLNANGVGIAAPQVNIDARIMICRFEAGKKDETIIAMINPEITHFSKETEIDEEGCLSLPNVFGKVERPAAIQVNYTNEKNKPQTLTLEGFNARIVQHELDHLNGILFIDYL